MILCQFSFATNDAMVKFVYQSYNEIFVLNQIIFLRGIFALFFIGLFLFFKKKLDFKIIFSSSQLTIRGLLESFAAICFFIGVATLPFGMVYVLLSLAPIILTTFGALFLNEKVRWRMSTAIILGFTKYVFLINPRKLIFVYFLIFPFMAAMLLAIGERYTKKIK